MTTDTEKQNIAQTIRELAEGIEPVQLMDADVDSVVAIPQHYQMLDIEEYMPAPRRHDVKRQMRTAVGFAEYVAAHALENCTAVYVTGLQAEAVIDDINRKEKRPVWGGHKAILPLHRTPEWKAWHDVSGDFTPQRPFVDFIQDRAGEIVEPALADLVQQLRGINAETTGSRRDAAGHLNTETARQLQTKITNELPEYLELSMPILSCEPDVLTRVRARLYVKLDEAGVKFAVILVNAESLMDARIREFVAGLGKRLKNVPVYF